MPKQVLKILNLTLYSPFLFYKENTTTFSPNSISLLLHPETTIKSKKATTLNPKAKIH